jgi:hypothetical protein
MSETSSIRRPRAAVLGFAAAALASVLLYMTWPAASPAPAPSNQPREQRPVATTAASKAQGPLDVRLDALKQPPPEPGGEGRNPFRFYVKPPPPPPPQPVVKAPPPPTVDPNLPPPPPPIPPIPLKFIGTMEQGKKKVAIFAHSDGRGVPVYASEGELVLGQYRVVRIQLESVVMEYADGRGRQTIPMRG